ncbi:hypothetical protein AMET1_1254 [Methanonatronarchaeum thermophilum]|uniref:Uncharacterized protein n=1 Tax=Methanonatronarchaeum thermophilum TaxID=1927129 RepID=A0A1Y3GA70_9EURY|nr:hypothetical protein [Methanonatronarchaeum thermophilum]OUJ18342.1 hypothetical protein AMET1_1254 [Methanonatronarchaeum thermophilum]
MKKIIVLITLLAVVIGLTTITGCLNDTEDIEFSIPTDYIQQSTAVVEGFQMTQYIVEDKTTSEIINELTKSAEDADWKIYSDELDIGPHIGGIAFEKNDELLVIYVMEIEEQIMAMIMTGDKELLDEETNDQDPTNGVDQPPKTDVSGEELSELPRYTDAVRTAYWQLTTADESVHHVTYITEDELTEVKTFYEDILKDWDDYQYLQYQDAGETVTWLSAEKTQPNISTIIIIGSSDFEGYTEIYITYAEA